jgi:hypothetical protein
VRIVARASFLTVASDVAPEMLCDLAGAPLDYFADLWLANGGGSEPDAPLGEDHLAIVKACLAGIVDGRPFVDWCARWGMPGWDRFPGAIEGMAHHEALRCIANQAWGVLVAASTAMMWRTRPFRGSRGLDLSDPLSVASEDVLGAPVLKVEQGLVLPSLTWDPLREERSVAANRIMRSVRTAVRAELRRIQADALTVGHVAPTKRTGLEHLAWLARYQFRRESMAGIADDVCKERQTVDEAIRTAADLVGLVLRDPGPPGRPRRRTPRARRSRTTSVRN